MKYSITLAIILMTLSGCGRGVHSGAPWNQALELDNCTVKGWDGDSNAWLYFCANTPGTMIWVNSDGTTVRWCPANQDETGCAD